MNQRGCFRVNYLKGGTPRTTFVVAETGNAASDFVGVRDGSAQVSQVAFPVEVVGVDAAHEVVTPPPINVAPPDVTPQLSQEELATLREIIAKASSLPGPVMVGGTTNEKS